jgi:enediyne biosynthesis protein E4
MQLKPVFIRRNARFLAAILIVTASFLALRFSLSISQRKVEAAAARFRFSRSSLPEVAGPAVRLQRLVHPGVKRISAFVSTVGAAVAVNDMDGDGLSNDVCYIDTRTDQVILTPIPGTSQRYSPFALAQEPYFDRARMAPLGLLQTDLNEDGHVDLVVSYAGRTPLIFLWRSSNSSNGSTLNATNYVVRDLFSHGNPKAGSSPEMMGNDIWMTTAATAADLDGDGHLDLVFANYFKDGSDLYNPAGTGVISMPHSFSHAFNGGGERIYRWTGASIGDDPTVIYTEVRDAFPANVGGGWGLALGAYDLDGDLLPELYVAHDFGPDRLFWNRSKPGSIRFALLEGKRSFSTPKSYVLGNDSFKGMGVDFGDLNGDGIADIYVSNITAPQGLQEGQLLFVSTGDLSRMREGIAPYVNRSEALGLSRSGWAWEAKLDDFDNDGILEALQATGFIRGTANHWPQIQELATANDELISNVKTSWPRIEQGADIAGHDQNAFFVQLGDHYVDISRKIGFGEEFVSRGIAIGDVDFDGSLDMFVSNMWGPASYYHNESPKPGAFLGLHLRLPLTAANSEGTVVRQGHPTPDIAGRAAISAAVMITLPNGKVLTRQIDSGNGHAGKRSTDLHFGLGKVATSVNVRIDWRDATGQVHRQFLSLKPGWYTVLLGSPGARGSS